MLELNEATTANAVKRTYETHPRVSRVSDTEIAVTCANAEHPGGHICHFSRHPADDVLFGECVLRATGELCPAAIGKHVCYHLTAALPLFLWLESYRRPPKPERVAAYKAKSAWLEQMLKTPPAAPLVRA